MADMSISMAGDVERLLRIVLALHSDAASLRIRTDGVSLLVALVQRFHTGTEARYHRIYELPRRHSIPA